MYAKVLKANPYHDEKGRFSTQNGAVFVSRWAKGVGSKTVEQAKNSLSNLPKGAIFSDAKDISTLFTVSTRAHNSVLVDYEEGESAAKVVDVPISAIHVTQRSVREGKLTKFLDTDTSPPPIPGVLYGNKVVITDGHHRLVSAALRGKKTVAVSLVKGPKMSTKKSAQSILDGHG